MSKILLLLLLSFPLLHLNIQAKNLSVDFCSNVDLLAKFPIQINGRTKPLFVHTKSIIKHLTHKTKVENKSSVELYCLLSLQGLGLSSSIDLQARIDHIDLQKFLNLSSDNRKISYNKLLDMAADIRQEMRKTPEGSYQKALMNWVRKISLYQNIITGQNWKMPNIDNGEVTWLPLSQTMTPEKIQLSLKGNDGQNPLNEIVSKTSLQYIKLKGDLHLLEYKYAKANLPVFALFFALLALVLATLTKKTIYFLTPTFITVIILTIYLILRSMISGRAPITNMYETVLFSGYGALLFAIVIGHIKKDKLFLIIGVIYSCITLMMMLFANGMLNEEISPLVPVLRDNFWLSTHVTALMLSYGCLALSWVLGNTIIIKKSFFVMSKKEENHLNGLIYTILKSGTTLLAAGVILGGVWADYSWGRFWGWDPKETWSLIVLCTYIAILHGRYTSWITPARFAPITAGAFMTVMMAWFGVNYILATGLHSYGFSQGGAVFLSLFFLIQILILIITKLRAKDTI